MGCYLGHCGKRAQVQIANNQTRIGYVIAQGTALPDLERSLARIADEAVVTIRDLP